MQGLNANVVLACYSFDLIDQLSTQGLCVQVLHARVSCKGSCIAQGLVHTRDCM